jgi:hypothetical protein
MPRWSRLVLVLAFLASALFIFAIGLVASCGDNTHRSPDAGSCHSDAAAPPGDAAAPPDAVSPADASVADAAVDATVIDARVEVDASIPSGASCTLLIPDGCPPGQGCYWLASQTAGLADGVCLPFGTVPLDKTCMWTHINECATSSSFCLSIISDGAIGYCRLACDTRAPVCPNRLNCVSVNTDPVLGFCGGDL